MTIEQKMQAIKENYMNGNIQDAIELFKKLPPSQRQKFAVHEMNPPPYTSIEKIQQKFSELLIRDI